MPFSWSLLCRRGAATNFPSSRWHPPSPLQVKTTKMVNHGVCSQKFVFLWIFPTLWLLQTWAQPCSLQPRLSPQASGDLPSDIKDNHVDERRQSRRQRQRQRQIQTQRQRKRQRVSDSCSEISMTKTRISEDLPYLTSTTKTDTSSKTNVKPRKSTGWSPIWLQRQHQIQT